MSVKLWFHSDMHIWFLFLGPGGYLESKSGVHLGLLGMGQGSHDLVSDYGAQRACFKAWVHRDRKGSNPTTNLIESNP